MTRTLLAGAAALALLAAPALAQGVADQVVAGLQAQGFERIEVKTGPTQVKVEGVRGGTEVEYVYDLATGALLSEQTGPVDDGDDTRPGVEYDTEDEDFVGPGRGSGGSGDDDGTPDQGGGGGDDGDDDSGRDGGGDDGTPDQGGGNDDDDTDDSGRDGGGDDGTPDQGGGNDDDGDDSGRGRGGDGADDDGDDDQGRGRGGDDDD